MKTHSITIILFTSMLSVIGCGGEGESSASQGIQQVETTTVSDSIQPEVVAIATAELVSIPEFSLTSYTELQVSLPASPSTTISYFINICTNFSSDNDNVTIHYDSCKLRTMIGTAEQQYTLYLSATENQLIAQIWPIENATQPINIYWNIAELGNYWQIIF